MQTFRTADPAALAAYRAAIEAQRAYLEAMYDQERGGIDGTLYGLRLEESGMLFGQGRKVKGLATRGGVKPGWKWSGSGRNRYLVPAAGRSGAEARHWLETHQPPAASDELTTLLAHGLPRNDLTGGGSFNIPDVFEHDDALWAGYKGRPGHVEYLVLACAPCDCTWPLCTEHQFLAAKHAMLAAEEAEQAERTAAKVSA